MPNRTAERRADAETRQAAKTPTGRRRQKTEVERLQRVVDRRQAKLDDAKRKLAMAKGRVK
jgi:hypothetical protein